MMNKIIKFIVAVLGGVNVAFSIFIPFAIVLLIIKVFAIDNVWLLVAGGIASLYRAIDVGFLRN